VPFLVPQGFNLARNSHFRRVFQSVPPSWRFSKPPESQAKTELGYTALGSLGFVVDRRDPSRKRRPNVPRRQGTQNGEKPRQTPPPSFLAYLTTAFRCFKQIKLLANRLLKNSCFASFSRVRLLLSRSAIDFNLRAPDKGPSTALSAHNKILHVPITYLLFFPGLGLDSFFSFLSLKCYLWYTMYENTIEEILN